MKKNIIIVVILLAISFIISICFLPQMPDKIASHWNYLGEVDGYMPKIWGVFMLPVILSVCAVLFLIIPLLDPLKKNYDKFRKYYNGFIIMFFLFMIMVQLDMLLWNIGIKINPNLIFPAGIGIFLYYAGILTENAKMNWFVGVRTPWTLSSEVVWDKTNKLAGKLFKAAGIISVIGTLFGKYAFLFVIVPALATAAYSLLYSYLEYQRQMKK